jgi:hypothetical protein
MKQPKAHGERGISLLFAMFTLLLVTAIAMGMMFMASTETSINANFKSEETTYFAARAGLEEMRDRMLPGNPNTLSANLPAALPGGANDVLYLVQPGVTAGDITNFASNNPLVDDELCHDWGAAPFGGMTYNPANVRCTDLPAGTGWFTTVPSVAPFAGSANPIDFKWVRVTLKRNDSTPHAVGGAGYLVADATQPAANKLCWDGTSEVAAINNANPCSALTPTANPVYLVTSLAVSVRGTRRMIQQEIAQDPSPSIGFPYGLFATGTGCGALNLGGGAQTFSFNSSAISPPGIPTGGQINTTGGNIGSNGNISIGGNTTSVNGSTSSAIGGIGNCNQGNGITLSGSPNYGTPNNIPVQNVPVPAPPNPLPPTNNVNYGSSQTLPAGSYGNVNITGGTITLTGGPANSPTIYTMNSISLTGGATLQITGGAVILNIAGVHQQNPVNFAGGSSLVNTTYNPANFVMNYGGNNNLNLTGGNMSFAVINAPNANISFSGGSNFYGQAIGRTITNTGGTNFYYDSSLSSPSPTVNNSPFREISMRELAY